MDDLDNLIENSLKNIFIKYEAEIESFQSGIWEEIKLKLDDLDIKQ